MSTKQTEALKLALEALELNCSSQTESPATKAMAAIREAQAEQPAQQEPVLWLVNGVVQSSDIPADYTGCLFTSPQPAQQQNPLASSAWQEGYDQGVADERTSEANIGIAGFGAKVNPARNNPYTAPQPTVKDCLTVEQPASKPLTDDTRRLDALAENSWDLRCFDMPTGAGDADIGWRVIEHHMAKPHERTVGEVYQDDPRKAIDRAIEAAHGIKGDA